MIECVESLTAQLRFPFLAGFKIFVESKIQFIYTALSHICPPCWITAHVVSKVRINAILRIVGAGWLEIRARQILHSSPRGEDRDVVVCIWEFDEVRCIEPSIQRPVS